MGSFGPQPTCTRTETPDEQRRIDVSCNEPVNVRWAFGAKDLSPGDPLCVIRADYRVWCTGYNFGLAPRIQEFNTYNLVSPMAEPVEACPSPVLVSRIPPARAFGRDDEGAVITTAGSFFDFCAYDARESERKYDYRGPHRVRTWRDAQVGRLPDGLQLMGASHGGAFSARVSLTNGCTVLGATEAANSVMGRRLTATASMGRCRG
jgi:hypothetical protein